MKYRYLLQNKYESISNLNSTGPDGLATKIESPKRQNILGDFTIYKVNKEFEHFWYKCIKILN